MSRRSLALALGLILTLSTLCFRSEATGALARQVPAKNQVLDRQTAAPSGRLVIKFRDDSGLIMGPEGLAGADAPTRTRVQALVADKAGAPRLQRHFSQDFQELAALRQVARDKAHRSLPDLNTYAALDLSDRGLDRPALLDILKTVLADPAVETAFLEPVAVPAALGFDAFTGKYTRPRVEEAAPALADPDKDPDTTSDYTGYQGYLGAPPEGVNALAAASTAGALGSGVSLVDVELGWRLSHEDLPAAFLAAGNTSSNLDNRNHGTAVLGEIVGQDNGYGVRGIAPATTVGVSSAYSQTVSSSLLTAWAALDPGDVILIELHAPGPNATGEGQEGYVPMEYWQDIFDVIQTITAAGGVIVEAAGNGGENLDDPVYNDLFDREYRDSGAIMCGAATAAGAPYSWSNHGTRVDLNGWGGNVATCGYGDLQSTSEDEYYTRYFSGTSSASPIVTGAVVALQGMAQANYALSLEALTIRELLVSTGTPQLAGILVGPRPDIMAAYQNLEWGLGEISGVVTDADTGLPVAGVDISVTDTHHRTVTDEQGAYALVLPVGSQELNFSQFFYQDGVGTGTIVFDSPATLDLALAPWPTVDVHSVVSTAAGDGATAARLTVLNAPLVADEQLLLAGVPIGRPLQLLYDNQPGHGAVFMELTPEATPGGDPYIFPVLPPVTYDFEHWWYNFTALSDAWVWGTPTSPVPFSGISCWGVGLNAEYPDNGYDLLTSPDLNLAGHEQTLLSFHFWCDMEDGMDGVQLQIRSTNNNWITLAPLGGYSHERVQALGNQPGWSGNSGGWQGAVFDISEYTELLVAYRFKFASDLTVKGAGFYLDDIAIDHGDNVSGLPGDDPLPAATRAALSAHPNPFNPTTTIDWEISRPGSMQVRVYDARGRLVRELLDQVSETTRGRVVWDGRDALGRSAASGAYLVQVRDSAGQQSTRAVTLLK